MERKYCRYFSIMILLINNVKYISSIYVLRDNVCLCDDIVAKNVAEIAFSWYLENDGYNVIRPDRNRKGGGIDCYIKPSISFNYHRSLNENFENILIDILLPKSKPITLDIIYRPPDQASFIDDFNIALKELASQGNETYFLGDFNMNLFFEGQYVLKKSYAELKEAQSNQRLLKPSYLEVCSGFGRTQLINKPTRPTLKISSLIDHILRNLKESVTQDGVIKLGLSDHDLIFCTRKTKCFKSRKHNTILVRTCKSYSKSYSKNV